MNYRDFWQPLVAICDAGEARAVARMVYEVGFGLSMSDLLCGKDESLPAEDQARLAQMQQRLLEGEPVQYVLGVADFGPRQFRVTPAVLIPRPETYELCRWVGESSVGLRLLDIGTGSGCIACTLAAEIEGAQVTAWDISERALEVARANAESSSVLVQWVKQDALHAPDDHDRWDVIVSNPPYVCQRERVSMERGVLAFEPHLALFVPDDDPLLFYRAIAIYGRNALRQGGALFFEINPIYARETEDMLRQQGFDHIETRRDQFGKERFTKAIKR